MRAPTLDYEIGTSGCGVWESTFLLISPDISYIHEISEPSIWWLGIQDFPTSSCVTVGNLLDFFELQFPHL